MASMAIREPRVPSPIPLLSLALAPSASIPSSPSPNSMHVLSSLLSATPSPQAQPAKISVTCACSSPRALKVARVPPAESPVENRIIFPLALRLAALGLVRASKTKTQDRRETPRHSRCFRRSQSLHRHSLTNHERLLAGQ